MTTSEQQAVPVAHFFPDAAAQLGKLLVGSNVVADDARALVIAAREFWDPREDGSPESRALLSALEAFSSRVPYEDEPTALGESASLPCKSGEGVDEVRGPMGWDMPRVSTPSEQFAKSSPDAEKGGQGLTANTMHTGPAEHTTLVIRRALVDPLVQDNLPRWILDGWTQGNETWEETDEGTQERAESAARAVLVGLKQFADDDEPSPDAAGSGGEADSLAIVFREDVLTQASRLGMAPNVNETPGSWRDRVRETAIRSEQCDIVAGASWTGDPNAMAGELRRVANRWGEGFRLPQLLRDAADEIDCLTDTPDATQTREAEGVGKLQTELNRAVARVLPGCVDDGMYRTASGKWAKVREDDLRNLSIAYAALHARGGA